MKHFDDLINEASLSRLRSGIDNHDAGAITAFRGEYTRSENKARNRKLLGYLKSKGYAITSVKGSYIENFGSSDAKEVGEESYFVIDRQDNGDLKTTLERLGNEFDQDSILWVAKGTKGQLIGTSRRENAFPPYKQTMDFSKSEFGRVAGAFFSRVKGRQFTFAEDISYASSITNFSPVTGYEFDEKEVEELEESMMRKVAAGAKLGAAAGEAGGAAGVAVGAAAGAAAGAGTHAAISAARASKRLINKLRKK